MMWNKVLGSALGVLWLAGAAGATNSTAAYVTLDFNTMAGIRGVTTENAVTKLGATGGGDPRYVTFEKNGVPKVLYREFQTGDAPDTVTVFDPTRWSIPEANTTFGKNIGGAAVSGTFLFLANYYNDGQGHSYLTKHDMNDPNYRQVDARNLDDGDATNLVEYVKDVLAWKDALYVLVERRDNSWPINFAPSALVRFNAQLAETGSVDLGKNASSMALGKDSIYITVMGGARNASGNSSLVAVDPATLAKTVVGSSRDLPQPYAFDQVGVAPDGTLFVTGYYNDAVVWPAPNPCKVFTAAPGTPRAFVERDTLPGWVSKGLFDGTGNCFWVVHHGTGTGNSSLVAYDAQGNRVRNFSETTLGGMVYDATPVTSPATPTTTPTPTLTPPASGGSGGGGGCVAGTLGTPWALLLLLPACFLRRQW